MQTEVNLWRAGLRHLGKLMLDKFHFQ